MRWIVFVLGLLLTPSWISYSFLAGSGPKVAFIPPALVLVALVFTSLWKRLVVNIAGELEPSYFHPYWGTALLSRLSRGSVRTGLVAAAVGVCAGAIVALTPQLRPDADADNQSAALAPQQKRSLVPRRCRSRFWPRRRSTRHRNFSRRAPRRRRQPPEWRSSSVPSHKAISRQAIRPGAISRPATNNKERHRRSSKQRRK